MSSGTTTLTPLPTDEQIGHFAILPQELSPAAQLHFRVRPLELLLDWHRCFTIARCCGSYMEQSLQHTSLTADQIATICEELLAHTILYIQPHQGECLLSIADYQNAITVILQKHTTHRQASHFANDVRQLLGKKAAATLATDTHHRWEHLVHQYGIEVGLALHKQPKDTLVCLQVHIPMTYKYAA